jgi:acyl dehydratase
VTSVLRFFEDFPVGWSDTFGPISVTKDDIVSFAREYDAQPFHTDEEAAKSTFVGALIASGWHTCALNMRLVAEGLLLNATSMGAPGVEEVKWLIPVRPDDRLRSRATVTDSRISKSRPEIGFLLFRFEMLNQRDETVLAQSNWAMFGRRGHPWPPAPGGGPLPPSTPQVSELPGATPMPFLEDMAVGAVSELGSCTFTAEDIIRYAKTFDPQPFHVDPEAAKWSLFGGLCASGWHTAAIWMKQMIAHRERSWAESRRRGEPPPQLGPSPGFKNLKWSKPVYAGDTITYRSQVIATRPSASRPGWGLAFHRNSGVNQHGEEVFGFDGAVFWEMRRSLACASSRS